MKLRSLLSATEQSQRIYITDYTFENIYLDGRVCESLDQLSQEQFESEVDKIRADGDGVIVVSIIY